MQVRKKVDILEAFRFGIDAMPDWFMNMVNMHDAHIYSPDAFPNDKSKRITSICVNRAQGLWIDAKFADVIVKDVCGIVYPVEPAVFGLMFEVVKR